MLVHAACIKAENDKLNVSISIGATPVYDNDSIDTLMKRADALLYENKRAGLKPPNHG